MFHNLPLHLSLHFHNLVYSHHISYTSMCMIHPFHYLFSDHISLMIIHPLSHFNMFHSYIFSHLYYNSYNPLLAVSLHPHMLLHILLHLLDNSYNLLPPLSFSFNNTLYILTHLPDNYYNPLQHLFLHFNTSFAVYLILPHISLTNLLNMYHNLLIHLSLHFSNLVYSHHI